MLVAPEEMEGKTGLELLAMGMKSYFLGKYADAVSIFSKASEVMVEEHKDDKHDDLGNVYLYYGKSLLELTRSDPFGEGVPKEIATGEKKEGDEDDDSVLSFDPASSDDDDDEDDDEAEGEDEDGDGDGEQKDGKEVIETEGKTNGIVDETKRNEKDGETTNGDVARAEIEKKDDEEKVEEVEESGDDKREEEEEEVEESTEDAPEDGGEGTSADKGEEEPTDLQLAWEVLELAKLILKRRGDPGREDYSECLVTLGEVSLENENFDNAIADIRSGLEIQKEIFTDPLDKRKLAQTYYKYGLALTAHNKIQEGIDNYQTSIAILTERLRELEAIPDQGISDLRDIREIKSIVPEMEEKIADLRTYKEEVEKKKTEEAASIALPSPEKKANDISHLVKRKRKIDEVAADTAESAAKKMAS